jgi:hypothetical protein
MPAILIRHTVTASGAWRPVCAAHGLTRRATGARGGRIYGARGGRIDRSEDDPNLLLLLLEGDDRERARLFADSDDLGEAMTRAGVTDRPDIWLLEDVAWLTV